MGLCQSCGVPFEESAPLHGSNKDGTANADYCEDCYKDGLFTQELTMAQMIERQVPYLVRTNPGMGKLQAKDMLAGFIPELKRWKETK